jgi:AcrR family transcriptional regulator
MTEISSASLSTSDRALRAAAHLLETGGVEAVSTRAVAAAAGIQPPTLYRQFGDKEGLLDAVTSYVLREYLADKRRLLAESGDPVADLRGLWDQHVEFGFTRPDCYQLTYGRGRSGVTPSAARETIGLLQQVICRLADQGYLRMSVERATQLFHSCGVGFVMTQIVVPPAERDSRLSVLARENALSAIADVDDRRPHDGASSEIRGRAAALREAIRDRDAPPLTHAEHTLLAQWLTELADQDEGLGPKTTSE